MKISTISVGTFTIAGVIIAVIGLLSQLGYITFAFHILSAIILLLFVLVAIFMILLYLIETNGSIKTIIKAHVKDLDTNIKNHKENCSCQVTNLTALINKLSTNIKMQKKDVTKQEEDTNRLRNKFDIIQNWAMEKLLKDSLEDTQKANPNLVKKGSYILTDEGEETLPKDLKKMIENMVLEVKMESPEDALDLLAKIGRDELKEFAKQSNLQFKEIVALSILYATKMSEWSK